MTAGSLDIILPCFNPVPGWAANVISSYQDILHHLPGIEVKLFIVNDGSSHGVNTSDIEQIESAIKNVRYISYPDNRGKGSALRSGVLESTAAVCIYTDIDFPYTTESFIRIWNVLKDGAADIAPGIKDKSYYSHVPAARRMISKALRVGTGSVLRLKVADTQCGLKGFNEVGKKIFLSTSIHRYLFDLEFIFLASRRKDIIIQPVEIQLKENIQFSSMRLNILLTEGMNFIKIFFKSL